MELENVRIFDFSKATTLEIKKYLDSFNLNNNAEAKESEYMKAIPHLKSDLYSLSVFVTLTELYLSINDDYENFSQFYQTQKYKFKQYSLYWKKLLDIQVFYLKKSYESSFNKIINQLTEERFDDRFLIIQHFNAHKSSYKKILESNQMITGLSLKDMDMMIEEKGDIVNLYNVETPNPKSVNCKMIPENESHLTLLEGNSLKHTIEFQPLLKEEQSVLEENEEYNTTIKTTEFTLLENTEQLSVSPTLTFPYNQIFKGEQIAILGKIGKGGYSSVVKCLYRGEVYAMKKSFKGNFYQELKLLERLSKYSWAIKLIASENDLKANTMTVILEYGEIDLQTFIENNTLDKHLIKHIWRSILKIISNLHQLKIIHKDIKPSNFVFSKGQLKIIDFGISVEMNPDATSCLNSKEGTAYYSSPEVFYKKKVSRAADIWSAGCILFYLIYKKHIYNQNSCSSMDIAQKLLSDNLKIDFCNKDSNGSSVNPLAIQVMKECLMHDPKSRPTSIELLNHPFLS